MIRSTGSILTVLALGAIALGGCSSEDAQHAADNAGSLASQAGSAAVSAGSQVASAASSIGPSIASAASSVGSQAASAGASLGSRASSAAASAGAAATSAGSSASSAVSSPSGTSAASGGTAAAGMKPASNPRYAVGSTVKVMADHVPGMRGATGKVVAVYDTTAYAVDYRPTNGAAPVENHKWVVQQELKDAGGGRLANGTKVTLEADHEPGMKGASGTIVSSTTEPVYQVDVQVPGHPMPGHKWVVQSELQPA